jgi:hypothetical protein
MFLRKKKQRRSQLTVLKALVCPITNKCAHAVWRERFTLMSRDQINYQFFRTRLKAKTLQEFYGAKVTIYRQYAISLSDIVWNNREQNGITGNKTEQTVTQAKAQV